MSTSLKSYLKEDQRVDESLTLLAIGLIAWAAKPALEEFGNKAGQGVGDFFGGLASLFRLDKDSRQRRAERREEKRRAKQERKEREQERKEREQERKEANAGNDDDNSKQHGLLSNLLALAQTKNPSKSDKQMIQLLQASSVDADGNAIPLTQMGERMKELTGQEPKKLLAANGVNVNLSDEEADDISKQATTEIGKLSQDKRDEIAADGLKQAQDASKAMQTYKDKKEELEKQLDNAKESKDEGAIEKAQAALDDFKKNAEGPAASLEAVTQKASETNKNDGGDEDTGEKSGEDGEPEGTTAKEEEVTDKETGKKVKRKVYTGPKGGRYYYPDGKPHTPEHKVYVESLTDFLRRTLAD